MKLTRRGNAVIGVALVVLLWAFLVGAFIVGQEWKQDRLRSEYQTECQEDMPCWDCSSMGNRICGPTTEGK